MNALLSCRCALLIVLSLSVVATSGCLRRKRVKTEVLISAADGKISLHAVSVLEGALKMKKIAYTGDSAAGILSVEFEGSIGDLGLESTIGALDISCDVVVKETYVK